MTISVLPVPVAPETRMIESRKNPPPHIASSSALPEAMRSVDDFWLELDRRERDDDDAVVG